MPNPNRQRQNGQILAKNHAKPSTERTDARFIPITIWVDVSNDRLVRNFDQFSSLRHFSVTHFYTIRERCAQRCTPIKGWDDPCLSRFVGYRCRMSDIALMGEDEWASARMAARAYNTVKLREMVEVLAPYVDGSMGVVSAPHLKLYLQTLKDMAALYQLSAPPALSRASEEAGPSLAAGMARSRALEALQMLESRARGRSA